MPYPRYYDPGLWYGTIRRRLDPFWALYQDKDTSLLDVRESGVNSIAKWQAQSQRRLSREGMGKRTNDFKLAIYMGKKVVCYCFVKAFVV